MSDFRPFMEEAVRLAISNVRTANGGPFAALVVDEDKILSRGTNLVTITHDPTAHAEVVAIRRAAAQAQHFHLSGATLISTCEPCPMCLGAAYWARIERIVYASTRTEAAAAGFLDEDMYRELALPPDKRSIKMIRLDDAGADRAFEAWRDFSARVEY